tara:strand:- start:769 stop:951 length:183 start_codon:yes stop_codon:yes gene_type:complete
MEDNSLDVRHEPNESLKNFNKKIAARRKKLFEEPNVKPAEVFEGYKEKQKKKKKKKSKSF